MTAVGLDIGAVRTKIAVSTGTSRSAWHEPSARLDAALLAAFANAGGIGPAAQRLSTFLGALLERAGVPHQATIVVAVPDRWTERPDGPWRTTPGSSPAGASLLRLMAELGFPDTRLISGTQCVAASGLFDTPMGGCLLVCDVGAETVGAAVYSQDGDGIRMLDAEHAPVGESGLRRALLDAAGTHPGGDGDARVIALEDERCARAVRAELVLARAAMAPRYSSTPAYLAGPHGADITAAALRAALGPLAELAARVVRRLLARVTEPLVPELILTGGNALGPVAPAVAAGAGDRVTAIRRIDTSAAAGGALRIATGAAVAVDGYPHQLGIAIRRIRNGLLEPAALPVGDADVPPAMVTVEADQTGPLPVVVRVRRAGPWRETEAVQPIRLPAGRYRVYALGSRAGLGATLWRPVDGGSDVVYPLGPAAGEIHQRGIGAEEDV